MISEPVGDIDSRKELNKFIANMSNETEAMRLKFLIKEYGLQREVEAYEVVKDALDEPGTLEAWTIINGFPVMAFGEHVRDSNL
jgi:hypothetical protein